MRTAEGSPGTGYSACWSTSVGRDESRDELVEERLARRLDDRLAGHRDRGVEVVPLSRYAIDLPATGLVIGFGQPTPPELHKAAAIIGDVVPRSRNH